MKNYFVAAFTLFVCELAFGQNYIAKQYDNGLWGYTAADDEKKFVITPQFDDANDFVDGLGCVKLKKKFFFIDASGNAVTSKYSWVDIFDDCDMCKVADGNKYGFIDRKGKEIIEPKYDFFGDFTSNGLALVGIGCKIGDDGVPSGGKFGYMNRAGTVLVPIEFDFIGEFDETGFCWVNKGGSLFKGDKNINAQMEVFAAKEKNPAKIIKKRDELEFAVTGGKRNVFGQKAQGGLYGLYSSDGKEIVPVSYEKIGDFHEGMCRVLDKKGWGYIDKSGKEVIGCCYADCSPMYSCGMAWVAQYDKQVKSNRYAYVNKEGKLMTEFKYVSNNNFDRGLVIASVKTYEKQTVGKKTISVPVIKTTVLNTSGSEICGFKYDAISSRGNFFLCRVSGKNLLMDRNGTEITPALIMDASQFINGIARVRISKDDAAVSPKGGVLTSSGSKEKGKGCWVLIDTTGKVISSAYVYIGHLSHGMYVVANEKKGAIDSLGNETVPLKYDKINDFSEGYASVVNESGKWGFIDNKGNIVIDFRYDDAGKELVQGVGIVRNGEKWGGIGMDDKEYAPAILESSKDVYLLLVSSFNDKGKSVLNLRDVEIFVARKKGYNSRFAITDKISDEYWDY